MRDSGRTVQDLFLSVKTTEASEPAAHIALGQVESIAFQTGTDNKADKVVRAIFRMKSGYNYHAAALFYGLPGAGFANELSRYVRENPTKADFDDFCRARSTAHDTSI